MIYYTHGGYFHCDEVTGFVITKLAGVCDSFKRLDDLTNLPTDGLIADIGREYDPEKSRFDHHHFQKRRPEPNGCMYATAGLLWLTYGRTVVRKQLAIWLPPKQITVTLIDAIFARVDRKFIQGIDANDADSKYEHSATHFDGREVEIMTLPQIVGKMNLPNPKSSAQFIAFHRAVQLIEDLLIQIVNESVEVEQIAYDFFEKYNIDPGDEIAVVTDSINWRVLPEILARTPTRLKYVILPSAHPGNPFCMVALPVNPNTRRLKLPILRPTWFEGFIHNGQFIAGADSVETLRQLATFNLDATR